MFNTLVAWVPCSSTVRKARAVVAAAAINPGSENSSALLCDRPSSSKIVIYPENDIDLSPVYGNDYALVQRRKRPKQSKGDPVIVTSVLSRDAHIRYSYVLTMTVKLKDSTLLITKFDPLKLRDKLQSLASDEVIHVRPNPGYSSFITHPEQWLYKIASCPCFH